MAAVGDVVMDEGRIEIVPGLSIGADEIAFSFVRASGPGGQNVNKVASAVQLRFDAASSPALDDGMRARLRTLAGRRMTADGVVIIAAQRHRSQEANRRDAIERLIDLLRRAALRPRARRPTRPSAAAKRQRRETKRRRGGIKRLRGRPPGED
jgi:ribosome-associated protein